MTDRVKFQFATSVAVVRMTAEGTDKPVTSACAPAFSTLKGIGKLKVDNNDHPAFIVSFVAPDQGDRCKSSGLQLVRVDDVVVVRQTLIFATPPDRYGLTYGVALLGTVKDTFQLGVVMGADRVNRNVKYAHNNKPWTALSLGFDFSN